MRRKHTDHLGESRVDSSALHNPLQRRSDRLQARARTIVVTLLTLMLPFSVWLGTTTLSHQQQLVAEQQITLHSVTAATAAEATADTGAVQPEFSVSTNTTVDATWTYLGVDHTGQVSVETNSPAGTEVPIWVDDNGDRSIPPLTPTDAVAAGIFAGAGSYFTVAMLLWAAYAALRFHLDSKRDAEWELAIRNFMDENSLS